MKLDTTTILLLAGAFLLLRGKLSAGSGSEWMKQAPVRWWINPETGNILDSPGLHPPFPGYRPASEYELINYGHV